MSRNFYVSLLDKVLIPDLAKIVGRYADLSSVFLSTGMTEQEHLECFMSLHDIKPAADAEYSNFLFDEIPMFIWEFDDLNHFVGKHSYLTMQNIDDYVRGTIKHWDRWIPKHERLVAYMKRIAKADDGYWGGYRYWSELGCWCRQLPSGNLHC